MTKGNTDFSSDQGTGSVGADSYVLAGTAPTLSYAGGYAPIATTSGTDTTPVVTEAYISEVAVVFGATITGAKLLNGSGVAGNVTAYLAKSDGTVVASSASTAQANAATFQSFAFSTAYAAKSGKYFLAFTFDDGTTARLRTIPMGAGNAGKLTGLTYGTFPNFTPPSTFTASLGPVSALY